MPDLRVLLPHGLLELEGVLELPELPEIPPPPLPEEDPPEATADPANNAITVSAIAVTTPGPAGATRSGFVSRLSTPGPSANNPTTNSLSHAYRVS
jgi:hypothetical protein